MRGLLRNLTPKRESALVVSTWVKLATILLTGFVIAGISGYMANIIYRDALAIRVQTVALTLDTEKVASLGQTNHPKLESNYQDLRIKLTGIKDANQDLRFVYLMGKDQEDIYFLADSEPESSSDHSPLGEVYPDASEELKQGFSRQKVFVEGPVSDEFGDWLSALAPVTDPKTGKIIAMAGADIPANDYYAVMTLATAAPITLAFLLAVIVVIADRIRTRRLETLRFRSELVSIASHELRSPLTGIKWSSERLMKGNLEEGQIKIVKTVHESILRLQESIEDILQMASLDRLKAQELNIEPTDMTALLGDIYATQRLPAEQKRLTLAFTNWPEKLTVKCDAMRMKRVFNNLISNAIKYTRDDTTIELIYEKRENYHCILIKDQGIGIPQSEQDKIFSGFYRATNAIKSKVTGTGMGLYLSRTIVEQHQGKVWLESEEGKGTTVYVCLPE